jgi:hypothetical protein
VDDLYVILPPWSFYTDHHTPSDHYETARSTAALLATVLPPASDLGSA